MAKGHRAEWKIFDRLKFILFIEKIEFYFTLKNLNYFPANSIELLKLRSLLPFFLSTKMMGKGNGNGKNNCKSR